MKLKEKYKLLIPDNKIRGYLLSIEHPIGKHKARFFIKCGKKFIVIGIIIAPNGENYPIKTVWINSPGTKNAIFVTAHPI